MAEVPVKTAIAAINSIFLIKRLFIVCIYVEALQK